MLFKIQKCLDVDWYTKNFNENIFFVDNLYDKIDISNDSNIFCFGSIEQIRNLIANHGQSESLDHKFSYYNDMNINYFMPFIKSEYLNYDGYFKTVCQIGDKEIGKFCRSNSGNKVLSGQVLKDLYDINFFKQKLQDDDLLYFSDKKQFFSEWRFWIHDEEIIEYSMYMNHFSEYDSEGAWEIEEVIDYVNKINSYWTPNDLFVIDVCVGKFGIKVVEYNCLSTSGFYNANINKICEKLEEHKWIRN